MSDRHMTLLMDIAARLALAIDADGEVVGAAVVVAAPDGLVNHMTTGEPGARVKTVIFAGCSHQLDALRTLDEHLYVDITPPDPEDLLP